MKKLLLIIMCLMTLTLLSAQKPPKPINLLGKSVQYVGVSTDKIPSGEGVLTIKNGMIRENTSILCRESLAQQM